MVFADIQIGQHVLLDAANRGAGHLELAAPAGGQLGRQRPADWWPRSADHECLSDSRGNARVPHAQTLDNAKRILQEAASVAPTIMLGPAPALDAVLVD